MDQLVERTLERLKAFGLGDAGAVRQLKTGTRIPIYVEVPDHAVGECVGDINNVVGYGPFIRIDRHKVAGGTNISVFVKKK